jgi:uncharacterized protein YciW
MTEGTYDFGRSGGAVRSAQFKFLEAELAVARAMLDLADGMHDAATVERRRAKAREAYGVVARHLADDAPGVALTDAERQELRASLAALTGRVRLSESPASLVSEPPRDGRRPRGAGMGTPRFSPELEEELALAMLDDAATPSTASNERLTLATNGVCAEARRAGMKPEDMVIALKRLYEEVPGGNVAMQGRLRSAYDRLLTGCIRAYFSARIDPATQELRSPEDRAT